VDHRAGFFKKRFIFLLVVIGGIVLLLIIIGFVERNKKNMGSASVLSADTDAEFFVQRSESDAESSAKISLEKTEEDWDPPGFLCERISPDEKVCRRIADSLLQ
jgi:hypothetical protein